MDLEKMLTQADKLEINRLDKYGDFLNGMADVSDFGAVLFEIVLFGMVAYYMCFESIPLVSKVIITLFTFYFPWAVWVIKYMGISINWTISDPILIISGIVVGARIICLVLDHLIDRANRAIDEILSKYKKEENVNE